MTLSVTNFGPIAYAKVDLRPLSVFIGPSNTGKSYMAVLVYALSRFLAAYSSNLRSGRLPSRYYQLGMRSRGETYGLSTEDVEGILGWASHMNLEQPGRWNQPLQSSELPEPISALIRRILREVGLFSEALDEEIARCYGVEDTANLIRYPVSRDSQVSLAFNPKRGPLANGALSHEVRLSEHGIQITASIPDDIPLQIGPNTRVRDITSPRWRLSRGINAEAEAASRTADLIGGLSGAVVSNMADPVSGSAYYLPADRAGVMHAHRVVVRSLIARASRAALRPEPALPALSGVLGDFLELLIDMADYPQRAERSSPDLSARIEEEILGGSVLLERGETGYPSFVYRPGHWDRDLPLMNASSMVSEMAPVVLYLRHLVKPGDLLIIEEPESHLHPEMQVAFTRELVAVVKSGIHVIMTTHSEWVLEELANLVLLSELPEEARTDIPGSESALAPHEIGAWLFGPRISSGGSVVEEISLDKDSGTFPARYGVVTEDLYNRFATISNRIEERKG